MRTSIAFSVRVLWVCACLGLCLVTAAHDAELNAAHRDLMQNRPVCNGRLVRRTVLMEKTRNNRRIRYGDIVTNISYMKVRAFRAKESLVLASDNDAMATNFGTDGRVLIISQNNNQAKPVADPKGGFFVFTFDDTAYQLHSIKLSGVTRKGTAVVGPSRRRVLLGENRVRFDRWFNVKKFQVNTKEIVRVAEVVFTQCVSNSPTPPLVARPSPPPPRLPAPNANPLIRTEPSSKSISETARYSCRLVNKWSATRHPVDYPTGRAHWSPPVLVAHDSSYAMWETGKLASSGAQLLAETGLVSDVLGEIRSAGFSNAALVGDSQFNDSTQSQRFDTMTFTARRPLLSSMTMVAPSPDWFTGLSGFDMRDTRTNTWYRRVGVETPPYDAGTDSGNTYTASDNATQPQARIFELKRSSLSSRALLSAKGNNVLPVASWECELINP